MKQCNPLLKSWTRHLEYAQAFVLLRPFGFAFTESTPIVPNEPCQPERRRRVKRKGRR